MKIQVNTSIFEGKAMMKISGTTLFFNVLTYLQYENVVFFIVFVTNSGDSQNKREREGFT